MKNILVSLISLLAVTAFADRTANQEWVKRNFAPTNLVPRVEALEQGGSRPTITTNDVKNIVRNESSLWDYSNIKLTNTITSVIDDNITNVVSIVNAATTNAVEVAMNEMVGEGWKTKYGGGAAGIIAAILAAIAWLKKNKANKSDSISGVKLNGTDLDIDATTRKASGTVLTCNPFPEGTITGIGTSSGVTTIDFCKSLCKNTSVVAGMMYLGQVRLAEGVGTGGVLADQSEVTVKCIKAVRNELDPNDPENYEGIVILVLEMTSTNQGCRHWMTVYERWGKKSYDYTTYPNGKLAFGSAAKPWYGMLYSVLDDQAGAQNPLAAAYTAASKADVKIKDFQTTGSGNVVTGVSVSANGMMTVTLGNVSGPAEATDAEIGTTTAPTVSNKMITPKNAPYAVAQGLIHEAQNTAATHVDLSTEQQRDIQTWLGVNELTFVIDNGDSTTTTRKFKFVCTENESTNA